MAIRILTDSTSDITQEQAKQLGIIVVPLAVLFGEEVFYDGVTLKNKEYYERLRSQAIIPTTAQPSPGEFAKFIKDNAAIGDTIVCVHISSKLSGTIASCKIAAEMLADDYKFEFVDSEEVCSSLGLIVLSLNRMVQKGASVADLLAAVPRLKEQVELVFAVGTLEFLEKNGRIGKATSYLGGLLNIKPVLEIADGLVSPVEKIRGNMSKVCNAMVDRLVDKYGDVPLEAVYVHSDNEEYLAAIQAATADKLNIVQSSSALIGPVIGSHAGPLTVGLAVLPMDL